MSSSATDRIIPCTARDIIRHFSPTWFAATMGTGAISILFFSFPYGHDTPPMKILSLSFFFLNLFLFLLLTVCTVVRYAKHRDTWWPMLQHPTQSLFTGCFPMGITTLINVSVDLIYTEYGFGGTRFLYFIWAVWWIDIFISVVCCWGMVHIMTISHTHTLQEMTAAWLLPVVTLTVAASSGGVLSLALTPHSPSHALLTTTLAVFLVTVGLTLALMIMTIYLLRLILYGLPPGRRILSVFLPLGPTAQSGYAVLLIGQNYRTLLPLQQGEFTASQAGETVYVVCVCVTLLLWSLAVMCIAFAMLGIFDSLRRRSHVPFGLPFWGLVFPNGVFANLTLALARTFDARFFRVLGSIYAVLTLLVWCFVAIRTARVVWDRTIFDEDQQMDPGDDRGRKLLRSADTR